MNRLIAAALVLLAACADPPTASTSQDLAVSTPWHQLVIANDLAGADGHATADVDHDGDADVGVAWEESSRITVYARPANPRITPWPLLASYAHSSAEDVTFCDLDGDTWPDLASFGEDKKVRVARNLGGTFAAPVIVATATNLQQWMQGLCVDVDADGALDLVVGGRVATAPNVVSLYILRSPTPWVGASWTRETIGPAGWTMYLDAMDVDLDGLVDIVATDRLQAAPAVNGVRYWTRITGAWASVVIAPVTGGFLPRFGHRRSGTGTFVWGEARSDGLSRLWLGSLALPFPGGIGPVHGVRLADADDDGDEDVFWTTGEVDGIIQPLTAPGVGWLRREADGSYTPGTVSGPTGGKWDEATLLDVTADGKLDLLTTEQRVGLGVVLYEQP